MFDALQIEYGDLFCLIKEGGGGDVAGTILGRRGTGFDDTAAPTNSLTSWENVDEKEIDEKVKYLARE